jgi:hypothetical protein
MEQMAYRTFPDSFHREFDAEWGNSGAFLDIFDIGLLRA